LVNECSYPSGKVEQLQSQLQSKDAEIERLKEKNAILMEAVENISEYQVLSFSARMASEALEKIKQLEVGNE